MRRALFTLLSLVVLCGRAPAAEASAPPLRVVLIPADGGTADGTLADYEPIFQAIGRMTGLGFQLRVGQNYGAVVEAMRQRLADIAFFGPVSYIQARDQGAAELLAVGVQNGASIYYAAIFVAADSPIRSVADLRGRSIAFGDINSTSSFAYPVIMLLEAGLDPPRDLGAIRFMGSHAGALRALAEKRVDAACASFDSFAKAVRQNALDPAKIRILAKSDPIPYPPLAMHPSLPAPLKAELRAAFASVDHAPGITPEMIRGYGGEQIERYSTTFTEAEFARATAKLSRVTEELKGEMLRKASQP